MNRQGSREAVVPLAQAGNHVRSLAWDDVVVGIILLLVGGLLAEGFRWLRGKVAPLSRRPALQVRDARMIPCDWKSVEGVEVVFDMHNDGTAVGAFEAPQGAILEVDGNVVPSTLAKVIRIDKRGAPYEVQPASYITVAGLIVPDPVVPVRDRRIRVEVQASARDAGRDLLLAAETPLLKHPSE